MWHASVSINNTAMPYMVRSMAMRYLDVVMRGVGNSRKQLIEHSDGRVVGTDAVGACVQMWRALTDAETRRMGGLRDYRETAEGMEMVRVVSDETGIAMDTLLRVEPEITDRTACHWQPGREDILMGAT